MIRVIKTGFVNVFLIGEDPYILVDTGVKSSGKKILNNLYDYAIDPKSIKLIVLTHGHDDHIGSLKFLRRETGAEVLMSETEFRTLTCEKDHEIKPVAKWMKVLAFLFGWIPKKTKPIYLNIDILMETDFDLNAYGVNGRLLLTCGHSKGSLSVIIGDKAIVGDSLMAFSKNSKPHKPFVAYSLSDIKMHMEELITLGVKEFYLSHGKKYGVDEIKAAIKDM